MTLKEGLLRARRSLGERDIEDASLRCEVLLRHVLGISRVQLYLDLDRELSPEQEEAFWGLIGRCLNREPVAYITGHKEFYGLDFYVDSRVLIPRPETELMVEKALHWARHHSVSTIADIGTGCGAIAISLALNLPQAKIYATDISSPALEVARFNCQKHGVLDRICLLLGNLLEPLPKPVDLIVANLPYVRESDLRQLLSFEPRLALDGGPDGLDKIRELCYQIGGKLNPSGGLLLEIGQGQGQTVVDLLRSLLPSPRIGLSPDLAGIDRVVSLALNKSDTEDFRTVSSSSAGLVTGHG